MNVGIAIPSNEPTITFLRGSRSVNEPNTGADKATPSVAADTVSPTAVFDEWNNPVNSGRRGCVQ